MISISTSLVIVAVALGVVACSEKSFPKSEVYTLYSSNYPTDVGRSGVATFDLADTPEMNGQICQEAADLYQADFEKRKERKRLGRKYKDAPLVRKGTLQEMIPNEA